LGFPLPALGLLNQVIAGAAMAFSSASVVNNGLLLKRWKSALGRPKGSVLALRSLLGLRPV
jgi:Cu+-exporting ATPase